MTAMHDPTNVRVLDSTVPDTVCDDPGALPASPQVLAALGRRVGGTDLAAPPAVLPDPTGSPVGRAMGLTAVASEDVRHS